MNELEQFHTREKANKGIKLPLVTPTGEETDHFLMVLGVDSDEFRDKDLEAKREMIGISNSDSDIDEKQWIKEKNLELLATLIGGWSFKEELTIETAVQFLKEAPQIANKVNEIAANRKFIFGNG